MSNSVLIKNKISRFFLKKNQPFKKIYIERPKSYRNLVNQDEIKALLKKEPAQRFFISSTVA